MRRFEKFGLPESEHAEVVAEAPMDRDHLLDRLRGRYARDTPEMRLRYTVIITYEERIIGTLSRWNSLRRSFRSSWRARYPRKCAPMRLHAETRWVDER